GANGRRRCRRRRGLACGPHCQLWPLCLRQRPRLVEGNGPCTRSGRLDCLPCPCLGGGCLAGLLAFYPPRHVLPLPSARNHPAELFIYCNVSIRSASSV